MGFRWMYGHSPPRWQPRGELKNLHVTLCIGYEIIILHTPPSERFQSNLPASPLFFFCV
jgi:hypothetical protein